MITTKPKQFKPKHSKLFGFSFRKFFKIRYRFYAILVIFLITPLAFASDRNVPEDVPVRGQGYEIASENWLFNTLHKVPSPSLAKAKLATPSKYVVNCNDVYVYDNQNNLLSQLSLSKDNVDLGAVSKIPSVSIKYQNDNCSQPYIIENPNIQNPTDKSNEPAFKPIDPLNNIKVNPQVANLLTYDKYKIRVPIVWSTKDDLYENSKPRDTSDVNSPIQQKLRDGIVHLATSPLPGEIGNSYIIGHSSNYSYVKSAYNSIFRPIQERSEPGEEFVIYDQGGRELKFRVFEVKKIAESDSAEAYKKFDNRRVVTLQTSILTLKDGKYQATHRWLTRGELINPDTDQPYNG